MKARLLILMTALAAPAAAAEPAADPRLSGGETTVFTTSDHAFSRSAANLPVTKLVEFAAGNRLFNTNWVIEPASVAKLDGLGPLFNRVSCSSCHVRDGRGYPPSAADERMMSMLVRLSVPGKATDGGPKPHPVYGGQLQDRATPGAEAGAEGWVSVSYTEQPGQFADGETYSLRVPHYTFKDMGYGELGEGVMTSPRVANPVHGLGLLEAVDEATILAAADPDDRDDDGVSGRPNYVWNAEGSFRGLGRFGWKANQPSLKQQAAAAFNGDIGITTSMFAQDHVTESQAASIHREDDGEPECDDEQLRKITFYLRALAVPARRDVDDPAVQAGEHLFSQIGCAACHTPSMRTGKHELAELSGQTIQPFTDLLLHDMGEGLADGRPDYEATGREWRTPPLWGIGLTETVNRHTNFLHDGRARNLQEAILWHGGEAEKARDGFKKLSKSDREAVIAFLNSL